MPNIKSVDTIYLEKETITPRRKQLMQSQEFRAAYYEALMNRSPDSSLLEKKSLELLNGSIMLDSTTFVCYHVVPLVIFRLKNDFRKSSHTEFYFTNDIKITNKYYFIKKVSKEPEETIKSMAYMPFQPWQYARLKRDNIPMYYY